MKKLSILYMLGVFSLSALIFNACCDDDDENLIIPENPENPEDPKDPEPIIGDNFAGFAINLNGEKINNTASFNGEGVSDSRVITNSMINVDLNFGQYYNDEYKQGYSYAYSLNSHQLIAKSGDEIELIFEATENQKEATFTLPDGKVLNVSTENPKASLVLPEKMEDSYVITGESHYELNGQPYIQKAEIEILREDWIIFKKIKYNDMTILPGGWFEIPLLTGIDWNSSQTSVAKVENSIVRGIGIGQSSINKDGTSFTVTVIPPTKGENDIFLTPCLSWNTSIDVVKAYMTGYEIESEETNEKGVLQLSYALADQALFSYDFNANGLSSAQVTYTTLESQTVEDYISSNFVSLGIEEQGIKFYVTKDTKTAIGVYDLAGVIYIFIYVPVDSEEPNTRTIEKVSKHKIDLSKIDISRIRR